MEEPLKRLPHDVELKKWREGRIRPLPGNPPHDRPVSRWYLLVKKDLRPSLPRHLLPTAAKNNTEAYGMRFLRDGGIYHPDVVSNVKTKPGEEPCHLPTDGPEPR
jgi:hypothetical protein